MNAADIARYWAKVDKSGACWEWMAGKDPGGYGQFTAYLPEVRGPSKAHRIAHLLTHGSLTRGMVIDHICHNRGCVNPDHLREVTYKQNNENTAHQGNNTSGKRGVVWVPKTGKWRVQVTHGGRQIRAGSYDSVEIADAVAIAIRNVLFTHNDADRTDRNVENAPRPAPPHVPKAGVKHNLDTTLDMLAEVSATYEAHGRIRRELARLAIDAGATYQQAGDAMGRDRSSAHTLINGRAA